MDQDTPPNENDHADGEDTSGISDASKNEEGDKDEEKPRRRRRRRGGRRRGPKDEQTLDAADDSAPRPDASSHDSLDSGSLIGKSIDEVETETDIPIEISTGTDGNAGSEEEPKPKRRRRVRRKSSSETAKNDVASETTIANHQPASLGKVSKSLATPKLDDISGVVSQTTDKGPETRDTPPAAASDNSANDGSSSDVTIVNAGASEDSSKSSRKGWWQKLVE